MNKLSPEMTRKIIDALGGTAKVAKILNHMVTYAAVSSWKKNGMKICYADSLKLRQPYCSVWAEVSWL